MRRQLATITVMVLLLSLVTSASSASAAPPAAAGDPPAKVALDFFNAVRFGFSAAASYVFPAAGDLGTQLAQQIKNQYGGGNGWQVAVAGVHQVDAATTEVLFTLGRIPVTFAVTLRQTESLAGAQSWLVSGFAFRPNHRVDHEDLTMSVDPAREIASGTVSLAVTMLNDCPEIDLRCYTGLKASGAKVDGRKADFEERGDGMVVAVMLPDAAPGQTHVVSYDFSGTIDDKDSFRRRAYMDILPQGAYFSDIFGDDLSGVSAEADITLSVPQGWTVATVGAPLPADGGSAAGRQEFRFHRESGNSTLITVGNYTPFVSTIQGIPVSWYLMPEHAAQKDLVAGITDRTLAFALSHFGPDPYGNLTIAEIPPQHGGGTTNRNMIMVVPHLTKGLSAKDPGNWDGVVSHEVFHEWFSRGTNQFCYESLVNYAVDWMMGETDPAALRSSRAFHLKRYLTVPPDEEISILQSKNLYTDEWLFPIIYDKGAMIYGMLRAEIGDRAFEQTIRQFFASPVRSPDSLQAIAEQASGQDLDRFFYEWLATTHRLDLSIEFAWRQKLADGYHTSIRIINDSPIEVHHVPILIRTAAGDMPQIANLGPQGGVMSMVTQSPVTGVILDPDGVFLDANPKNNVIGTGLLDRGSPRRPWTIRVLIGMPVVCLVLAGACEVRRRDKRLILRRLTAHFGFAYLPSAAGSRGPELFMAAAKALGSPGLAHNVDGGYPCAFGMYRDRLVVMRLAGSNDAAGLPNALRIAVCFPHDGTGLAIRKRNRLALPGLLRPSAGPLFERLFALKAAPGQGNLTLDDRARDAVVAVGRTGAAGIRVTPFGACYYATGPISNRTATAVLDALSAIADSLNAATD